MPTDLINEVDKEVNDTNYLSIGTDIRSEIQGKLRNYLEREADVNVLPGMTDRVGEATRPPPGTSHMTNMPFTREARHVEQRFTERRPYERFPAWILPGSEAILPKKSAPLNLLDDETDLSGNFHYMANYNPDRELLVQMPNSDSMVQVDAEAEARA
jgi:hypothetical protein